jgi:hypothetical protein
MDDELITERRPIAFPQVFGCLRHVTGGLARHAALVSCLTEYCRQHELRLRGVFTDREATTAIRSPAFVGLLDALELPNIYLGPKRVAADRQRQITATDTRLIVVRSTRLARHPAPSLCASAGLQHQGETRDVRS